MDFEAYARWAKDHPAESQSFNKELMKLAGYPTMFFPTERNDVVWFNNWLPNLDCSNIEDIKYTELKVRNSIRTIIKFCRENMPGTLRNAYLYDIAPQLGSRCSRRLDGEYMMTDLDLATAKKFDDVIAWHSIVGIINDGSPIEMPYSCILPKKIENLLCPGRHLSADEGTISGGHPDPAVYRYRPGRRRRSCRLHQGWDDDAHGRHQACSENFVHGAGCAAAASGKHRSRTGTRSGGVPLRRHDAHRHENPGPSRSRLVSSHH